MNESELIDKMRIALRSRLGAQLANWFKIGFTNNGEHFSVWPPYTSSDMGLVYDGGNLNDHFIDEMANRVEYYCNRKNGFSFIIPDFAAKKKEAMKIRKYSRLRYKRVSWI